LQCFDQFGFFCPVHLIISTLLWTVPWACSVTPKHARSFLHANGLPTRKRKHECFALYRLCRRL